MSPLPEPKETSADEAYPPSASSEELVREERPPSPPAEAKAILSTIAESFVRHLTGHGDPVSPSALGDVDRAAVVSLLEEYKTVLPLVAEEDLQQLLAPEPRLVYEFEGEIGVVPKESNLQKEPKPAKVWISVFYTLAFHFCVVSHC